MRHRFFKRALALVVAAVAVALFCCDFYGRWKGVPMDVELEFVGQFATPKTYSAPQSASDYENASYWYCIIERDFPLERQFSVPIPENDFGERYIIYSVGRKMTGLSCYSRENLSYDKSAYRGHPVFDDVFHPNTIFFYRIPRIKIYPDLEIGPNEQHSEGNGGAIALVAALAILVLARKPRISATTTPSPKA
jgi:hypothetical protein